MRCLERNKQFIRYRLHMGQEEIIDDYGNATGQFTPLYGDLVTTRANVSAAKGEVSTQPFGESENYDKVVMIDDANFPIDERSVIWIDHLDGDAHDYIVKKVARSLNSVAYAVSKVNVS